MKYKNLSPDRLTNTKKIPPVSVSFTQQQKVGVCVCENCVHVNVCVGETCACVACKTLSGGYTMSTRDSPRTDSFEFNWPFQKSSRHLYKVICTRSLQAIAIK